MVTAYVVQVNFVDGAKFVTQSGKLSPVPKFFRLQSTVKSYISRAHLLSSSYTRYDKLKHASITSVVIVRDIEKGLKDSQAETLDYDQFMNLASYRKRGLSNPKAVYKIRLADKTFVRFGSPRPKFGNIWNRAGDVRSHITGLIYDRNMFPPRYKDAEVLEIVMKEDGIIPESVKTYPLIEFYLASPYSARHYQRPTATHRATEAEYV